MPEIADFLELNNSTSANYEFIYKIMNIHKHFTTHQISTFYTAFKNRTDKITVNNIPTYSINHLLLLNEELISLIDDTFLKLLLNESKEGYGDIEYVQIRLANKESCDIEKILDEEEDSINVKKYKNEEYVEKVKEFIQRNSKKDLLHPIKNHSANDNLQLILLALNNLGNTDNNAITHFFCSRHLMKFLNKTKQHIQGVYTSIENYSALDELDLSEKSLLYIYCKFCRDLDEEKVEYILRNYLNYDMISVLMNNRSKKFSFVDKEILYGFLKFEDDEIFREIWRVYSPEFIEYGVVPGNWVYKREFRIVSDVLSKEVIDDEGIMNKEVPKDGLPLPFIYEWLNNDQKNRLLEIYLNIYNANDLAEFILNIEYIEENIKNKLRNLEFSTDCKYYKLVLYKIEDDKIDVSILYDFIKHEFPIVSFKNIIYQIEEDTYFSRKVILEFIKSFEGDILSDKPTPTFLKIYLNHSLKSYEFLFIYPYLKEIIGNYGCEIILIVQEYLINKVLVDTFFDVVYIKYIEDIVLSLMKRKCS